MSARASRRLFRPRTIRGKLAVILAVPVAVVLVLTGLTVLGEVRNYEAASDTTRSVGMALTVQDLIHELQRERGLTNGLLGGDNGYRSEVAGQRRRVDSARAALDRLIADERVDGSVAAGAALDRLAGLAGVRSGVDSGRASRATTFRYFTESITALNRLDLGLHQAGDAALRRSLEALRALGEVKEAAAQERGFLNGVFAAGRFGGDEYLEFTEIRAVKRAAISEFGRYATSGQRAQADATLRSGAATRALAYEEAALDGADRRAMRVDSRAWWAAMTTLIDDLRTVQGAVGEDIRARAAELQRQAERGLIAFALLAALAVAGAAAVAGASARSITTPLFALAREANDVAARRLPDAVVRVQATAGGEGPAPPSPVRVPARSGTEIRSVAEALDRVQSVAFSLATEQAVLRRNTTESMANLGRRNQNLLRRQLGFISQLEREDPDPSALANLFELDHLATRMRRNAESLLVLVGESTPRRWSAPLPVADVIRAALAEVEEYRRVVLRRIDDALITGAVVAEIAHMLAELIENGLAFSPPDHDVEIYGRRIGTGYLIAIIDDGVGMSAEDLVQANARLRGEENFLVAPTRFLGHYVVGGLAQRLSVEVQLAPSPVTGITARVSLPANLLVVQAALEAQAAPDIIAAPQNVGGPDIPAVPTVQAVVDVAAAFETAGGPQWQVPPSPGTHSGSPPFASDQPAIGRVRSRRERLQQDPAMTDHPLDTVSIDCVPLDQPPRDIRPAGTVTDGPQRTRNGLVKRVRRDRTAPAPAASHSNGHERPVDDRSPGDVRAMLSSFRAGLERGERRWTAEGAHPPPTVHPGPLPYPEFEGTPHDR